ncbi:hypothetical protein BRD00_11705 [Halobacteriales archaeon QS_8_69_26]|nr:MAG: hypothetical protein BRD00_11705 [Halobacteriales archaeon QS_8_69_26]
MERDRSYPVDQDPMSSDLILGLTVVCIGSGSLLLSVYMMPSIVGGWLTVELVLAAGMVFAATFLITLSVLPEPAATT